MIIIEVAGGLGNQLQQYALYRKFLNLGKEARLDISWFREENQDRMLAKRELELDYFEGLVY
ncbi:MAG: alpha-1,2-fucosyltransferase, partial [Lachnospiraceae bacterium]|nr:alpha-1,2-fucosyltransferase [Lachnospiraceae bacterium]